jgi:hypothetical protein
MDNVRIQSLAIMSLAIANVWLVVQNVRWLVYANPVRTALPLGDLSKSYDPILEAPAILIGLAAFYILVYRLSFGLWKIRLSSFSHGLRIRALSINSLVLLALTGGGAIQWFAFFSYAPLDMIVVSSAGTIAAATAFYLEFKPLRDGQIKMESWLPFKTLDYILEIWHRPQRSKL